MNEDREHAVAREIIESGLYMVVATADSTGQPWASPVYYAPSGYRDFFWISQPDAQHSTNLRDRREVGIVIFDSTVAGRHGPGRLRARCRARAARSRDGRGVEIYSKRSVSHGTGELTVEDVSPPARHRLYQATAEAIYVLDDHDHRVEVNL